jgi:nucleoside-diphosphate-sugar epimerase
MAKTVLITGGAGFIASHCVAALVRHGYRVRALDNLDPQIHGAEREPPNYLDRRVELIVGDIRSPKAVRRALNDADAVLHLAARVGVGQSMYEVADGPVRAGMAGPVAEGSRCDPVPVAGVAVVLVGLFRQRRAIRADRP